MRRQCVLEDLPKVGLLVFVSIESAVHSHVPFERQVGVSASPLGTLRNYLLSLANFSNERVILKQVLVQGNLCLALRRFLLIRLLVTIVLFRV